MSKRSARINVKQETAGSWAYNVPNTRNFRREAQQAVRKQIKPKQPKPGGFR